jgi:3-hydroxyisobutyrate dehydrogenase-like beta-hydroxyacid dehydrogenase
MLDLGNVDPNDMDSRRRTGGLSDMQAAFIGLGNMGLGMAHNLLKAGIVTTVFDVRAEPVRSAVSAGAAAAGSCADAAAHADVVCVAVFSEQQVRDVLAGTGTDPGALAGAAPGTVVAVHSTISPALVEELAAAAAERGIALMDVAMTGGGDVAAAQGNLIFMVGGPDAALAKARPVLDAMARTVFHVGPLGSGVSAKIISNFLGTSNVALVREALRMSAGAGIGEKEILRIIEAGGVGSSWVSNNWQRIRTQEENYTTGKKGMVEMWSKDLKLAQGLAALHGAPAPIADFIVANVLPEVGANGLTG